MTLMLEQQIKHNEKYWVITKMTMIRDLNGQVETYCNLVTTIASDIINEPPKTIQSYGWILGSKYEGDVEYVNQANPEIHLRLQRPELVWMIKKPDFGNEWVVADNQLQEHLKSQFDTENQKLNSFEYHSMQSLLAAGNELSMYYPDMYLEH